MARIQIRSPFRSALLSGMVAIALLCGAVDAYATCPGTNSGVADGTDLPRAASNSSWNPNLANATSSAGGGAGGLRLDPQVQQVTVTACDGTTKYCISNNTPSGGASYFVPFRSAIEISSFYAAVNTPPGLSGVTAAAGACAGNITYMWSAWSNCSASCGSGTQTRTCNGSDGSTNNAAAICGGGAVSQSCSGGTCCSRDASWNFQYCVPTQSGGSWAQWYNTCTGETMQGPDSSVCPPSPPSPSGSWTAATSCSGTTQVTSYSCQGGNGACSGSAPAGSSVANSPSCGYVTPTGTWTAATSCSGTTQMTNYSCQGGNGACSGSAPAVSSIPNSAACGYVPTPICTMQLICTGINTLPGINFCITAPYCGP